MIRVKSKDFGRVLIKPIPYRFVWLLVFSFYPLLAWSTQQPGQEIYVQNCLVCHAEDGSGGMPGVVDLSEKQGWRKMSEDVLLKSVVQGIQSPGAALAMPPKGGNPDLTEAQLKAALRYLLNITSPALK